MANADTMPKTGTIAIASMAQNILVSGLRSMSSPVGSPSMGDNNESAGFQVQALWAKYEDIAMHFNELLMRLRMRSLAGIAAISTLVGIFAKDGPADISMDWMVAAGLFSAMSIIWVAIFCLDFFYYNKLLNGAVTAIKELETATLEGRSPASINLSTRIEEEFTKGKRARTSKGVFGFYAIVLGFLLGGSLFSQRMSYLEANRAPEAAPAVAEPPLAEKVAK